jgi:hypothetical protein
MPVQSPEAQISGGKFVRQLPDQRVEDNAFHLGGVFARELERRKLSGLSSADFRLKPSRCAEDSAHYSPDHPRRFKAASFCQRVEDNAFHLCAIGVAAEELACQSRYQIFRR